MRVTKGLQISAVIAASVLLAAACSSSKKSARLHDVERGRGADDFGGARGA